MAGAHSCVIGATGREPVGRGKAAIRREKAWRQIRKTEGVRIYVLARRGVCCERLWWWSAVPKARCRLASKAVRVSISTCSATRRSIPCCRRFAHGDARELAN
ncbi:protein of unknown function [Burkholderia multivorans]